MAALEHERMEERAKRMTPNPFFVVDKTLAVRTLYRARAPVASAPVASALPQALVSVVSRLVPGCRRLVPSGALRVAPRNSLQGCPVHAQL